MKIDSNLVGSPFKDYSVKIDWRSVMNYAAAIDDNNPFYFDDEREDGIVAHPMYVVAVTWPIIQNLPDFILNKNFPIKVFNKVVHYTEHIILHRLIKPNDDLTIKGKIVAVLSHRAGTQIIQRFDARDQNDELVFTEFMGGMLRGVQCIGESKGEKNIPQIAKYEISNENNWSQTVHIDSLRSFVYDGCTDIFFPIHTSNKFAHFVGLPGIILQGTATLAYAVKEIIKKEAQNNPLKIAQIACKFTGMVVPGTNISINLKGKNIKNSEIEIFFDVDNHQNKKAIRDGYVLLK